MPQGSYAHFCPEPQPGIPLLPHVTGWRSLHPQGWLTWQQRENQTMNGAPVSHLHLRGGGGSGRCPEGTPTLRKGPGSLLLLGLPLGEPVLTQDFSSWGAEGGSGGGAGRRGVNSHELGRTFHFREVCARGLPSSCVLERRPPRQHLILEDLLMALCPVKPVWLLAPVARAPNETALPWKTRLPPWVCERRSGPRALCLAQGCCSWGLGRGEGGSALQGWSGRVGSAGRLHSTARCLPMTWVLLAPPLGGR